MENLSLAGAVKGIKDWLAVFALAAAVGMYLQIAADQERRIAKIEEYIVNQHGIWLAQREEIVRLESRLAFTQEQLRELRGYIRQETPR